MYERLHCSSSSAFQNNGYFYKFKERETFRGRKGLLFTRLIEKSDATIEE